MQQQIKKTCLKKYGVTNAYLIPEVIRKCQDNKEEIQRNKMRRKILFPIQTATDICKECSEEAFRQFKTWSFPYPEISDSQIEWELNALSTKTISDKQFSSIIRKYHQSIWSCSKDGQMSPVDYWEHFKEASKDKWDKFYINRIVHAGEGVLDENKILKPGAIRYGFEVLRYSNCVSYLKPFLAKRLISTYLSEFPTIFCPMNGFSGILLGTVLGCGKRYIGQDLNAVQISEAENIVKILTERNLIETDQVSLSVKDVFKDSGKYDCLIVCPPYGSKEKWNFDSEGNCLDVDLSCEEWMDVILERYNCKRYLFIVDGEERTKFDDHVVEVLSNRSHFNQNAEKVILVIK